MINRYIKFLLVFTTLVVITLSGIFFYTLWKFTPLLPSYEKIINYQPKLSSRVYSSDGLLLKSFYYEERIFIPVNRIPQKIKNAFISAEDKSFYQHIGIDFIAIFRAIITNFLSQGTNKRVVGASTITQQVVKNLILSNEVSYERKIKEILLAIRIENILTKDQILELYLNDIYLGYGSYGIASASLNYFNKSIYELELHEIAYLAALPKAPNNYNPKTNYNNAVDRRNWVIDRMYNNGYINETELHYKKRALKTYKRLEYNFKTADYYYEEIRKSLYKNYGKEDLYSNGLVIKTSINSNLQTLANQSLINGIINHDKKTGWHGTLDNLTISDFVKNYSTFTDLSPFKYWKPVIITKKKQKKIVIQDFNKSERKIDLDIDENRWLLKHDFEIGDVIFIEEINNILIIRQVPKVNGSIIVLNPHNGHVLALSGGFSFKLSQFNRATQAKRQPGSAFKPFVYLAALNEGYTPSTLILDAPYVVDQGPGLPKWKPANYTEEFYGLTTMRTGIEKSRNLMTVRLANNIGMKKINNLVEDLGIGTGITDQLSMALGSGVVSLIDLTNAYGIIANGGYHIQPKLIKSIYAKNGKQIYSSNNVVCQNCNVEYINNKALPKIIDKKKVVINSKIAYQITSMMEGVITRGTAKKLNKLNVPLAGKTGTTNDNKDAWFIAYTPNLVVGIYIGHDKPKSLGYKQTASSVAVPIFKDFAQKLGINSNKIPFKIPSGISFVRIDPNTGLASNNKESILEPYLQGTEPFNNNFNIIDNLNNIQNNSISGTGGLLNK